MKETVAHVIASPRFDSIEQEAYLNLWRTYDRLRAYEDELFVDFGVTAQQYNALRLLAAAHPEAVPTLVLAEKLISRAPDITRMLDRLEERGWIRRDRPTSDRRRVMIRITPAGKRLLERIARPLRECHERQLGHMDRRALADLVRLLRSARQPHEPAERPWNE